MKASVENKIVLGFAASVLALMVLGWLSYHATTRLIATQRLVSHTREVEATLESGLAILTDAETEQRSYLLTGDGRFLKDSLDAQAQVGGWLNKLRALTADNPEQQRRLDGIEPLISRRLAILNGRIQLRQEQGLQAAVTDVDTLREGKNVMDQIRGGITEMLATEDQLFAQRQRAANENAQRSLIIILTASALACAIGLLAILWIHRDLRLRGRAEMALRESEARYRTLFDSIDEGFCIVEMIFDDRQQPVDYRFLEINPSFEKQTGLRDALGKRMRELAPRHEAHWFEIYGRIAMTGEPARFQNRAEQLHRTYDVYAFRFGEPKDRQVAILFNDITRSKEAEQEILRQKGELEAANKELESFSYSVSHDLRAPLRHIDGFVKLLEKRVAGKLDDSGRHYLRIIADSARQMGALIDDLLSFSRMSRADLRRSVVSPESLVQEVVNALQGEIHGRRIIWKLDALPQIEADPAMLRQVWANLIGNAVKYSRPRDPAKIEIGCDSRNGEFVFHVRDNGVGFDMQYAHKLFGVFQRLHRPEDFEGTGIGLANVQRIVHRHGGRVWADGKIDGGATFFFSLPKTQTETETKG